ncbi:MAG: UDP-galactose-lipid carrier transferase [Anaerolineae bacterium]|nr:UDP-galactose-lipid carrier transferase [Anaerolineae bacterium]
MLEAVDLNTRYSRETYQKQLPAYRQRLYELHQASIEAGIPIMIVFEGWDAVGKSSAIKALTKNLDTRALNIYHIQDPRTYETHLPWLWRFWHTVPQYGEIAIFDHSWYRRVLLERVEKLTPAEQWRKAYRDIVNFENTLANDGYVIIKFFLHISAEEQVRRFRKLEQDPLRKWHIQAAYWEQHHKYDTYVEATEEMFKRTHTSCCPWTIIGAANRYRTRAEVFETLISRTETALAQKGHHYVTDH